MSKNLIRSKLNLLSKHLLANPLQARSFRLILYTLLANLFLLSLGMVNLNARPSRECDGFAKGRVALKLTPTADAPTVWAVQRNERLLVLGKSADDAWLQVEKQNGRQAWLLRQDIRLDDEHCSAFLAMAKPPTLTEPPKAAVQSSPPVTQTSSTPAPLPAPVPAEGQGWSFKPLLYAIGGLLILLTLFGFLGPSIRRWLLAAGFSQVRKQPTLARSPQQLPAIVKSQQAVAYLEMSQRPPAYYPLNKPTITIGRDPSCEIRIADSYQTVSRRHAQIIQQGADYLVVDLNSASGVYLDNIRVGRNKLRDGVTLNIGQVVTFTFHLNQGSVAP